MMFLSGSLRMTYQAALTGAICLEVLDVYIFVQMEYERDPIRFRTPQR